jgi:hypothetical protein
MARQVPKRFKKSVSPTSKPIRERRYKGLDSDKISNKKTFIANRDLPEFCQKCFKDIQKGQRYYVKSKELFHYRCPKY